MINFRDIKLFYTLFFLACITGHGQKLATPTEAQYNWHEQERIMFIHFAPTTWSEVEQNDHSVPLERINPTKLNTDQWCEAALAWGAKQIIFVAKHSGGFCWWQTETTSYGIKDTPYKNGKGDVLKQIAASCKKYGLNLGVYIYPGDKTWGAMLGGGGKTQDPTKQEAYNKIFRTQLTEVLANYGDMTEVWFDGSCIIPIEDILDKYAKNAVIFQGPHANLRWPGTESGNLAYPAWNSVKTEDLKTGVSTQIHGTPNGDAWAPLETNTTLYDHYWFWSPKKVRYRKSLDHLMENYYKSVGYGSVFLLNASPDTTGLIPQGDIKLYHDFGKEIKRRFEKPLVEVKNIKGNSVTIKFNEPTKINHAITMEDYRYGERIRAYTIEGLVNNTWVEIVNGISVGRKKIDYFEDTEVTELKLSITKSAADPIIRSFSAYYVNDFIPPKQRKMHVYARPQIVHSWNTTDLDGTHLELKVNLKDKINIPGQYILDIQPNGDKKVHIEQAAMYYNENKALDEFIQIKGNQLYVNQTAQITDHSNLYVVLKLKFDTPCSGEIAFKPNIIH